ncbi:winged helix-turn-helix transcriptional regulator [Rhodohalobacter sp. 614A]|uniref:winged helix-turn-helix transcriptional regulator n=1 Tax=Rhodohalobacter sp. 614A TaxID=2908649 RepID=UPI001F19F9CC|nr:winged helix-turn-helix transcriptional regulator [Rhodohalobacter sp. 614A]
MKSTITGDIVYSQSVEKPDIWLNPLKKLFLKFGDSPADWEIYRGDSFQLTVATKDAVRVAILIKSVIKKQKSKKLDVRLAIGVGKEDVYANRVSEAYSEAFVYSGQLLDALKEKKIHLGIKSPWNDFDKEFNMMFKLALVIMNSWTSNSAEVAELLFSISGITQVEIAEKLGIAQSSVNDRIKRGAIYEIMEMEQYFRERIENKPYY